jgi:hypothetical protein
MFSVVPLAPEEVPESIISAVALVSALYSASVDDHDSMTYLLALHDTRL